MQNAQNRSCNFVHFCRLRSHNYGAIIQPSNETQTTGGTTEAAKEQTGQHDSPGGRIGAADIENRIRTRGKTESATRSGCIQRPGTFQSIRRAKREKRDRKHDTNHNQRRESERLSAGPLPAAALRSARTENKRKEVNAMIYYMNRETGELLTKAEMLEQAATEYDLNDETNGLEWSEYYDIIRES